MTLGVAESLTLEAEGLVVQAVQMAAAKEKTGVVSRAEESAVVLLVGAADSNMGAVLEEGLNMKFASHL